MTLSGTFNSLPPEVSSYILGYAISAGDLSSRSVCREWNNLTSNESLRCAWNLLKKNLPQGPIDFKELIVAVEQSLKDQPHSYLSLFKELAANIKQTHAIKSGLLFSYAKCIQAQVNAQILLDNALVTIWSKIQAELNLAMPSQTAQEIRSWLNDPANSQVLGTITRLDLANLGLKIIPPEIGKLSALRTLILDGNQLTSLPDAIWSLNALRQLGLSNNQLTSLPEAIGSLSELQQLGLNNNQLTALPEAIGSLSALRKLLLGYNQLTSFPEAIGSLSALQQLGLSNNQLTSLPEAIGSLSVLQQLGLSNNQLTSLPEAIGSLSVLQELGLDYNQLTSLPKAIGGLSTLQVLRLSHNQLISLPKAIGSLKALQKLFLYDNQLSKLPKAIGDLSGLKDLGLSNNQLTSLPKAIENLSALEGLELNNNQLSSFPEAIGRLSALRILCFFDNPLASIPNKILRPSLQVITSSKALAQCLAELSYPGSSSLARLYYSVTCRQDVEKIKDAFEGLSCADTSLIFAKVFHLSGEPQTEGRRWGEQHVFDDMSIFYRAIPEVIIEKYDDLPPEDRHTVEGFVYSLAGSPSTEDEQWGRSHALENLTRLADAIWKWKMRPKKEESKN